MAKYAIRVHHNTTDEYEGGSFEFTADDELDSKDIQLRLLEAINMNLAALAESAERITFALEHPLVNIDGKQAAQAIGPHLHNVIRKSTGMRNF